VVVARPGPPSLITQICTNALPTQITSRHVTSPNMGRSTGKVMDRNERKAPAPSMRAASYSSCGTVVIAA
jgi:hypothetical protein